jgi:hypothetical protein
MTYKIEIEHVHGGTEMHMPPKHTPTGSLWAVAYGCARRYQQDPENIWVAVISRSELPGRWSTTNPRDGLNVVRAYVRPCDHSNGERPLVPEVVPLPDEILAHVRYRP